MRLSRQGLYGLLLLAGAALVLGGLAWLPFYWQSTIVDQTDQARTQLRFIEARINAAKGATRSRLSAADDVTPLFLTGATPGLSLAELQARLASLATASHITLARSQPLQTDRQQGLAVLRTEIEASGSIENLRDFLLALETGEPLMFITQAQVNAPVADKTSDGNLPSENLTALLQVEAYGWWEATP